MCIYPQENFYLMTFVELWVFKCRNMVIFCLSIDNECGRGRGHGVCVCKLSKKVFFKMIYTLSPHGIIIYLGVIGVVQNLTFVVHTYFSFSSFPLSEFIRMDHMSFIFATLWNTLFSPFQFLTCFCKNVFKPLPT